MLGTHWGRGKGPNAPPPPKKKKDTLDSGAASDGPPSHMLFSGTSVPRMEAWLHFMCMALLKVQRELYTYINISYLSSGHCFIGARQLYRV